MKKFKDFLESFTDPSFYQRVLPKIFESLLDLIKTEFEKKFLYDFLMSSSSSIIDFNIIINSIKNKKKIRDLIESKRDFIFKKISQSRKVKKAYNRLIEEFKETTIINHLTHWDLIDEIYYSLNTIVKNILLQENSEYQNIAIKQNANNILKINNPSLKLQLLAITKDYRIIKKLKNPHPDVLKLKYSVKTPQKIGIFDESYLEKQAFRELLKKSMDKIGLDNDSIMSIIEKTINKIWINSDPRPFEEREYVKKKALKDFKTLLKGGLLLKNLESYYFMKEASKYYHIEDFDKLTGHGKGEFYNFLKNIIEDDFVMTYLRKMNSFNDFMIYADPSNKFNNIDRKISLGIQMAIAKFRPSWIFKIKYPDEDVQEYIINNKPQFISKLKIITNKLKEKYKHIITPSKIGILNDD